MSLTIVHVTASLSRQGSGVIRAILGLGGAQRQLGQKTAILGVRDRYTNKDMAPFVQLNIKAKRPLGPPGFGCAPGLLRELLSLAGSSDVLHSHSMWTASHWAAGWAARRGRRPLVIAPHGALDPWALANPRLRKRLAWTLFDKKAMAGAACLQALSLGEVDALKGLGLPAPVALIPNGIHLRDYDRLPPRRLFTDAFPRARDRRLLLFLSRLHLKKGLLHLVEAWAQVAKDYPDWLLVLAGPDANGFRRQISRAVQDSGAASSLLFTGPLAGPLKLSALNAAAALVLPSFSEGFTLALLEALACRRPILVTPQCYFPEAIEAGAGLEIAAPTARATAIGLRTMLSLSDRERRDMGRRGRALVERRYTWDLAAQKTVVLYHWLLGGGAKPDFIS